MIDLAAGGRRRIVYVTTRKRTEDLASLLTWQGTRAEAYHGAPLAVDDVDLDHPGRVGIDPGGYGAGRPLRGRGGWAWCVSP